ncbi:hypothetical protein PUNSTDRAFT_138040 [Punctularia strigosozonata HHB-11173 SS5]|uniref:Uncharacterized protein n=1 Tax=Punctularia strigosozonata (strain HHB-11173) TaxID=741275 RepID=R7S366_PUNST|nr:uncharacterized protein PUNSTDRAFT_138040 [Punctularia strigosozonata HHB-11173 SS5]EIN04840.1 hypothetical protein PUNSTDRAFT_138040 [Punctularia strigosozonata HHB-11173 SS5]
MLQVLKADSDAAVERFKKAKADSSLEECFADLFPDASNSLIPFLPATIGTIADSLGAGVPPGPVAPGAGTAIVAAVSLLQGLPVGFMPADLDQLCGADRNRQQPQTAPAPPQRGPLVSFQAHFLPPLPVAQSFAAAGHNPFPLIDNLAKASQNWRLPFPPPPGGTSSHTATSISHTTIVSTTTAHTTPPATTHTTETPPHTSTTTNHP